MKTLMKIAMIVLMSAGAWMVPQKAQAQFPGITFQVFYDQLSPYGAWVFDPDYGYVWIPDEGAHFYPYCTGGHWVFTVFGWTWASDYAWGWAPFHYGRWNFDPYYGWLWVPGNEWGPAWVTWRSYNDYYGWAPLGPNMTIQMTFRPGFYMPEDHWMFVRARDFDRPDLDRHFAGNRETRELIRNSRAIENIRTDNSRSVTYATGPNEKEFRNITGRDIKPLPVKENSQPGRTVVGKDQVNIYRPPVAREVVNGNKPAPASIADKNQIRGFMDRTKGDLVKPAPAKDDRTIREQKPPVRENSTPNYEKRGNSGNNANSGTVKQEKNGYPVQSRDAGTVKEQPRQMPPQRISPSNEKRSYGSSEVKQAARKSVERSASGINYQKQTGNSNYENRIQGQTVRPQNVQPKPATRQYSEPAKVNAPAQKMNEQKRGEPASKQSRGASSDRH